VLRVVSKRPACDDPFRFHSVNLLDRYIFKSVLGTCAATIGLFAFVLLLGNAVRDLLTPFSTGQIGGALVLELLFLLVLAVTPFALPMGILTGVLLTLGRLSADSEITAMRATGLSLARVARPIFVFGVLATVAALWTNFEAMPYGRVTYERKFKEAVRKNPLSFIREKTFIRDFKGVVVYIGEVRGAVLRDVWIWELDAERRVKRLVRAESGRLDFDETTNALVPTFTLAKVEERNPEKPEDFSKAPRLASFEKAEDVRIPLDRYFGRDSVRVKLDWMTYDELDRERARLAAKIAEPGKEKELARERLKLDLVVHDKFNLAVAAFSFALIGVPLGIRVSRRETSANLGVALALVLGFYFLTVMVKWLDRHPEYHPDLLLWAPNVIFIALGVQLFRGIER
jgi:lipopolysaccharide export system permease protein